MTEAASGGGDPSVVSAAQGGKLEKPGDTPAAAPRSIYRRFLAARVGLPKGAVDLLLHMAWWAIIAVGVISLVTIGDYAKSLIDRKAASLARRLAIERSAVVLAVFPNSPVSRPMAEGLGFDANHDPIPLGNETSLEYFEERGTNEATADELRRRFERDNVVLVVGHESSSTVTYLNEHLYENLDIPMPLVLPAVTNPSITTSQRTDCHILRLPATDVQQVALLQYAIAKLAPKAVSLIVDNSNKVYSSYIADRLVQTADGAPFVDSVGIGLGESGFAPSRLLAGRPDLLVFIGMEVQADVMLRRIARDRREGDMGQRVFPSMIFTDGVAGDVFEKAASQVMSPGDRIFLTGPFSVNVPKGRALSGFPNYMGLARSSLEVVREVLERAEFRTHVPNRAAVLAALQSLAKARRDFEFGGIRAHFDPTGDNQLAQEHLFELRGGTVWHSEFCTCPL